jgi:hypothetical protein
MFEETKMARPAKPKPAEEKRVRFTFEPRGNTAHGLVFEWIIHKAFDGKAKVGLAVKAFWLPFACRGRAEYSEAELREIAQQSIHHLEDQIQLIRESFGIEASRSLSVPITSSKEPAVEGAKIPESTDTNDFEAQFFTGIDTDVDEAMLGDFGDVIR